ncbi:hypothetical protein PROFUN_03556 [Planoprotostelium fungivorum]|uniref:Uncharacterized protein n=1 Tax=Planoprotostelium fungivorum TaxID=1890364 RepID=A0A2P6MSF7_9EUKA|nr:hypothetical protein PROFUN_03556 [Planoprotostelium fungivorum]
MSLLAGDFLTPPSTQLSTSFHDAGWDGLFNISRSRFTQRTVRIRTTHEHMNYFYAFTLLLAFVCLSKAQDITSTDTLLDAKAFCSTSSFTVYSDIHASITNNIAIDQPTSGLPFVGFINEILPLRDLIPQVFPSTCLLQVSSAVDARIKVSAVADLSVALPSVFDRINFRSFNGAVQAGLKVETSNADSTLAVTLVSPIVVDASVQDVSLVKLENGMFFRRVQEKVSVVDGRVVVRLSGRDLAGTYVYVKAQL